MNKAIQASGTAGAASAGGIGLMSAALGVVVAGAAAAVVAIGAVTLGLFKLGETGVETASSVESSFAGVLKTTQGLGTNLLQDLTPAGERVFQEFRDMAKRIPLTFEELGDIGQLVGQLGVAEDEIVGVTEVIAALGVSTDLSIQDAALVVSRFATVMSETGDVTTEEFERISSALVFLGNNFKARESEIILTARNIAGTASLFGFSEAAVLALGTAVIEAGVTAEAGGSAIQNTLTTIGKAVLTGGDELTAFAETAGVSSEKFAKIWKTDAQEAFTLFIEGLRDQGAEGILTLDDLDLAQRRSIRTLLGISKSSIDVRDTMEQSTKAFADNTALSREAEIRYATFDSQVQILKNTLRDLGVTIGLELIPRLLNLIEEAKPVIEALGEVLQPIVKDIADTFQEKLIPAFKDLAEAFGLDFSAEGIAETIIAIGESISIHIEDFSEFVVKIAELVELSKEKGLPGFIEGLGISPEAAEGIADAAVAIGAMVLAAKGLPAVTTAIAGLTAIFTTGAIANLGAFVALIGEAGLAGALVPLLATPAAPIVALGVAIAGLVAAISTIDEEDVTMFKKLGEQLGEIGTLGFEKMLEVKGETRGLATEAVNARFAEIKDAIINWFTVTLPEMVLLLSESISSFVRGVLDSIGLFFEEQFPELVTNLGGTIVTFAQEVTEKIKQEIINFWNEKWPLIKDAFSSAGTAIMNGFIGALRAGARRAMAVIEEIGNELTAAANKALGISSPSKVFFEIGENVMKGLTEGIENLSIEPPMAISSAMNRVVGAGAQTVPSSGASSSNVNRSFNTGDLVFNTQPESPGSVALTLQRLALMQQGV